VGDRTKEVAMDEKQKDEQALSEGERQIMILISFMMNEMAVADGFPDLAFATKVYPKIADIYGRYSSAAVRGIERFQKNRTALPNVGQA
jgi:hypothetical protein